VAHLARHYDVLAFAEAVRLLAGGRLPRRAVVLTFDDGYGDNYLHAWPILKKYRLPATFFVVTGALDGRAPLWWEAVAASIEELARRLAARGPLAAAAALPRWIDPFVARLRAGADPRTVARQAVDELNVEPLATRTESVRALTDLLPAPLTADSDRMLTWEEVREMHGSGMSIGSHTVSHAFLDELGDDGVRREVAASLEQLRAELGAPAHLFSYPRGRTREGVTAILRQLGIEAAVTTAAGRNPPGADPLQLRRIDAGYCRLQCGFDRSVFDAELQGWFSRARRFQAQESA
jgi:peptidoglycan/xylan/chitin deacetylase (PgdA/CDA1 family)